MNIQDSSQFRNCTSCQMCGSVCPVGAINICLEPDGFYRPFVNNEECINCSLCVKSCYKFDKNILQSDISQKKLYAAWAKDSKILEETTSGGIADILARNLIQEGYTCIGVRYDIDKNIAVGHIASTEDEILKFRGSKYIQSLSVDAFKTLVKTHKNKKYAVFGLPCHIYAIDKYLNHCLDRENHILIDLYCHGCPSLNIWKKYVNKVANSTIDTTISSVNFRSKVRGWGNFAVTIMLKTKHSIREYISPRINDGFYELFFSDLVLNDSCCDCKLRSTLEYSDIRLGDFWGKIYLNNKSGVSGITISTERGKKIFNAIRDKIVVEPQGFNNFLPYQSYGRDYNVDKDKRKYLLSLLSDNKIGINEVVSEYHKIQSTNSKIKRLLKNVIKLLPSGLTSKVKGCFYSFTRK